MFFYKNNVVTLEIDALDIDRFLEATRSHNDVTSTFFRYTALASFSYIKSSDVPNLWDE